ncbi:MAG: transporter substrate-binding domain-containing protein [Opitutaceae bacterium]|nr:transporter substrate-binding domain-containing protein [Opitutaceae bacterium]
MAKLLLIALLFLGLPGVSTRAAEPARARLRVGVEANSAPCTFADRQGQPAGFTVELLRAVAADQQLDLEYRILSWPDLMAAFRAGELDILCNVADTPDREAFILFSTTTLVMEGRLFRRRDAPEIRSLADLAGRKLAVTRDSRAHEYVREKDWNLELVLCASLADCLQAVDQGSADVLLATHLVTAQLIRTHDYTRVVAAELAIPDFSYRQHFGVPPGATRLLAALNEGLVAVHRNGTYDQLYEKWVGPLETRRLRWRDLQPYLPPLVLLAAAALGVLFWQRHLLRRVVHQARALRENEERLQLVFEGSQDGFWDWDVAGNRVLRSPRWAEMLGYAPEQIDAGRDAFIALVHPDDLPRLLADEQLIRQGKDHFSLEFRMRARSGEWKWILDRGKVVARDPATGEPRRITGTHTDITARKLAEAESDRLQNKMQETQKLESLGVLAGGIAHDFNNLLTVILGNAALARMDTDASSANQARLDAVVTSANRAAELCRQLLAYAGKGTCTIVRLNLNDVITDTTRLLELSIGKHARLEFALAPALPRIEADATQLRQVVMNLVINASEALGERTGTIRLATTVITHPGPAAAEAGLGSDLSPGSYVCMEVSDTGCGMPPEVLGRIFDPFFTTKFTGRGLGLAAVLGIVRTHHGAMRVRSEPGQGATFRIFLPVSQAQTAHPFPAEPANG